MIHQNLNVCGWLLEIDAFSRVTCLLNEDDGLTVRGWCKVDGTVSNVLKEGVKKALGKQIRKRGILVRSRCLEKEWMGGL